MLTNAPAARLGRVSPSSACDVVAGLLLLRPTTNSAAAGPPAVGSKSWGLRVAMHSSVGPFAHLPSPFCTSRFFRRLSLEQSRANPSLHSCRPPCPIAVPCFLTPAELPVCEGRARSLQPPSSSSQQPLVSASGQPSLLLRVSIGRHSHSSTCYPPSYAVAPPFVVPLQLPSQR